ncbi:hypothetical protein FANTH_4013 [Fusarium anthophilum]|uniref:Uncharacterized protein n=1 Tax=Fusarium anthophilum TaxID=48485 RepID=A0A8H5E8M0_9HYPO|nr:hypothetical protein FANTH_4013 [Fusarium anthophilum]
MTDAWPSGSRSPQRARNRRTPVQRVSSPISTGHEELEGTEDTIVVQLSSKAQQADKPPIPSESAPKSPNSERVHSSASAIDPVESSQEDSHSRMAGMEPGKQFYTPVAHNGAESPSQERKKTKIILRTPSGKADPELFCPTAIAPQQTKAASHTEKLDTPMRECMKKPTTDKLTGTAYGTIPGSKNALPSVHKPSRTNARVIRNQTLANIQPKGEPVWLIPPREGSYMHPPPEYLPSWHYQPGPGPSGNDIQPAPFLGATAGSASHHPQYPSYELPPPQGIIENVEQPLIFPEYFNHHETPAFGCVEDADNDSLVYEAGAQPKLIKVKYFPSCERCHILGEDCNGDSPCDSYLGKECDYKLKSQEVFAEVDKWRFFEACNRCKKIQAKRDAQNPGNDQKPDKPCDGQDPCGSCIGVLD